MTNRLHPTIHAVCLGISLLASFAIVSAETDFPLMTSCFEDAERVAEVSGVDSVKVRYASVAGGVKSCYAVQVVKDGRSLSGFLVGATLPAIQRFEQDVRKHVPEPPPPPPPPPVSAAAQTAARPAEPERPRPLTLAGLKGIDVNGQSVDVDSMPAKNLIVHFWSALDRKSVDNLEAIEYINEQYAKPRRLELIGVATARSVEHLKGVLQQTEVGWPQIVDRGQMAKRYNVDPAKPYLILDRSRNVVAALASTRELEMELRRMGFK